MKNMNDDAEEGMTIIEADEPEAEEQGDKYEDYEVKEAADVLLKAQEIKKDPKLFKLASDQLSEKADHIKAVVDGEKPVRSVADIRKAKNKPTPDQE